MHFFIGIGIGICCNFALLLAIFVSTCFVARLVLPARNVKTARCEAPRRTAGNFENQGRHAKHAGCAGEACRHLFELERQATLAGAFVFVGWFTLFVSIE